MGYIDKNRSYGIDYNHLAYKIMEKIKQKNNMSLIEDSNHIKNTFDQVPQALLPFESRAACGTLVHFYII